MQVIVEFTGIAKSISQTSQMTLVLGKNATIKDVIRGIRSSYPGLNNIILSADGDELLNSNVFILNGAEMVLPDSLDLRLKEGDLLTLLSVIVGG